MVRLRPGNAAQTKGQPAWRVRATRWRIAGLLAALGVGVYLNAVPNQFTYDDHRFIAKNESIRRLGNVPSFFVEFEGTAKSREIYRPIRSASFALDYAFWGLRPAAFHVTNLALHVVNAFLVFLVLARLFGSSGLAMSAALVFALHPVQTETVAWASSRGDLLFMAFCLLALLFHIHPPESKPNRAATGTVAPPSGALGTATGTVALLSGGRPWGRYGASLICFGLALLSKEHAMCLPMLVVLCDLWRGRRDWRRWLPFFALAGCYLVLRTAVSGQVSQTTYWGGSLYATALTMCRMAFRYAALLVAPVHLSVDWQPRVSYSLSHPAALASMVALAATVVWAAWALARGSRAAFPVLWFLIALLPVSNVIPLKALVSERFLYLPIVGFCVVAAGAFAMRGRAEHLFLLMALCSVFAARTVHRNHDWRDDRTLFARTVATCPHSYNAYFNLGVEYGAAGQAQRAVAAYRTAMRIEPRYGDAALRLARIHRDHGQLDAALAEYRAAAEVAEHPSDIHNEIGNLLYLKGELGGAADAYRRALGLDPRHSQAHFNLGCVHLKKGDLPDAVSAFRAHLRVRPLDAEAHNCLGHAFSRLGDWPKAVEAYQAALKLNPNLALAHFNLGEAYAGQGRTQEAIEAYESFLAKWKGSPERAEVARARLAALKGQR